MNLVAMPGFAGSKDEYSREPIHMADDGHETVTYKIATLIAEERLYSLFQPIIDVAKSQIMAHEGLIRGPVGSVLHLPSALFPAAIAAGMTNELEFAAAKAIIVATEKQRNPA